MNPFVFDKKIKAAIVSYKSSKEFKNLLNSLNIDVIETLPLKNLDSPVNDHPDMVSHPIDDRSIVVYYEHYNYYKEKLFKYNINVIPSNDFLEKKYPKDILLNISRVGSYYFYKEDCIDTNLNNELRKEIIPVTVSQGYAKCSSMIIKDNTVITTDLKLHKKYKGLNLNSYLLPPKDINLPGYSTGFIGGTCGNIGKDELIFYGNLEKYKYYDKLKEILDYENIKYYYPKTDSFIDRGSIIGIVGG